MADIIDFEYNVHYQVILNGNYQHGDGLCEATKYCTWGNTVAFKKNCILFDNTL